MYYKKCIYLITYLCFTKLLFAQSQNQISDRKIKTAQTEIFDSRKEYKKRKITTEYDKYGNIVSQIERDTDSNITKWEKSVFDNNNNEIVHSYFDISGTLTKKIEYNYNNLNQLVRVITTGPHQDLLEEQIFTFDKFGNKISESIYNNKHQLESHVTYAYDAKGMLTYKEITDASGNIIYSKKITYQYKR